MPAAFISRVSNVEVMSVAGAQRLSTMLLQRQPIYYGTLAKAPSNTRPRNMTFEAGHLHGFLPRECNILRRRGRPRLQWGSYMHAPRPERSARLPRISRFFVAHVSQMMSQSVTEPALYTALACPVHQGTKDAGTSKIPSTSFLHGCARCI